MNEVFVRLLVLKVSVAMVSSMVSQFELMKKVLIMMVPSMDLQFELMKVLTIMGILVVRLG